MVGITCPPSPLMSTRLRSTTGGAWWGPLGLHMPGRCTQPEQRQISPLFTLPVLTSSEMHTLNLCTYWKDTCYKPGNYFSRSSVQFQDHRGWFERFLVTTQFEFMDGYEMINIVFRSMEEVPYHFLKSSVKFQGHMGWKIHLDLIWGYEASCSYEIP